MTPMHRQRPLLFKAQSLFRISLALLLGAQDVAAQAVTDSTKSAVPPDSTAARRADTTVTRPDSAASRAAPAPTVAAPPADTVLAQACTATRSGASAPGLLGVVFQAHATESDRVAAAQAVGGTLAGVANSGEEYIRLPESAGSIRAAASILIQLSSVSSVSEMPCPR